MANLPKHRENPIITKLEADSSEFKCISNNDEVNTLSQIFKKYGYELRLAGGAVRDLLSGLRPKDLDFATTATPGEMKQMFEAENVRMINMNGEKHGTITPRINDKENFEVTTLRVDVVTNGRHAEVKFTTDWLLDASRRDLTINSMFCDLEGRVYDYFFGFDDLKEKRIRFVGDVVTRLREDYLRILRYFRFYGKISSQPSEHDPVILNAIQENADGLSGISGERIWTELSKILEGNFAGDLLLTMVECGLSKYIGLPPDPNLKELKTVWERSSNQNLLPITLLSSLLHEQNEAEILNQRLKLSRFDRDLLIFLMEQRDTIPDPKDPLKIFKKAIINSVKIKPTDVKKMSLEVLKYRNSTGLMKELEEWEIPKFPIGGNALKELGVESGRPIGLVLGELKSIWIEKDCQVSNEELLKEVPNIVEKMKEKKKRKK